MSGPELTAFAVFGSLLIFLVSAVGAVAVIRKAGYSGWWAATIFVPVVGFIMFLVFAFSRWPVQRRLDHAEQGYRSVLGRSNGPASQPMPTWSDTTGRRYGFSGSRAWDPCVR
jgi:Na+/melibiose symporter-like transporter